MLKKIAILVIALTSFSTINAQNSDYKNVISLTAGANIFKTIGDSIVMKYLLKNSDPTKLKANYTPTFQLAIDHGFGRVVSMGAAFSYNSVKIDAQDYVWKDSNGKYSTGNYLVNINRASVGVRLLFHYGNKRKMDLYSGIRGGISLWKVKKVSSNPDFSFTGELGNGIDDLPIKLPIEGGILPQIQIIPFALRGYITNNIGIGFETAFGGPYYASLNLSYRIGGDSKK